MIIHMHRRINTDNNSPASCKTMVTKKDLAAKSSSKEKPLPSMDTSGRSGLNHPLKQRDEDAMSSKRDEPDDSSPGNKQHDISQWGGGGGGGQYQYPQQPSFQQQQQALYQHQLSTYQAQQQHQQQQGRGGEPQTPQYPPADSTFPFGNASSSFSAELARHLANTPGGFGGMLHPSQQTPGGGGGGGMMMGGFGSGGAFSNFGQTPMTGASFGSSSVGGSLPTPQQATAGILSGSSYGAGSGGGMSQLDNTIGMGGIQPTPISLRGRPYQMTSAAQQMQQQQQHHQQLMMQHQGMEGSYFPPSSQQQQQQEQQSRQRKLESVNEEDPSLLRFESRPGLDHSPLAAGGGTKTRGGKTNESPVAPPGHAQRDSSRGGESTSSSQGQHASAAQDQIVPAPSGGILSEFPFVFDGYAAWVCRHCQHVPPYYRGGNYVWQASQPPPNHFVDLHLRFCPGLNPSNMPPSAAQQAMQAQQQQYSGGMRGMSLSQDIVPYPIQQTTQQAQQNPFAIQQSQQKPATPKGRDPPGKKSPQEVHTPRDQQGESGTATAARGVQWDPHSYHHDPTQYPYHPYPSELMMAGGSGTSPPPAETPTRSTPVTKRRKPSASKASPKGRRTDDATYRAAIEFLTKKTRDNALPVIPGSDVGLSLIERSDADLLTDYFFHMMQQLVVCRFSEKDRKTRGGKRENINIGYGGLQCIHCVEAPAARKFFWSTVDRLANSFAEIPSHVLKCKHCPSNIKDALLALKGRHADQMQMLPRGSQKVFFRRMWRRLHDADNELTPVKERGESPVSDRGRDSPPATTEARAAAAAAAIAAEAALKSPMIAAPAAASLLAKSAKKLESQAKGGITSPEKQAERVLLAIPEDKDWLSDMDCFVRNNIEVFSSKQIDLENAAADRKYPIKVGQVGIRCIHCACTPGGARAAAVSYPYSISGIYESVREFQRLHLENCQNIPKDLKATSGKLGTGSSSLSSVLRRYYVQAARALGLYDTEDNGIRAGGKPMPMSTAGFQSPASTFRPTTHDAPGSVHEPGDSMKSSSSSLKRKVSSAETAGEESTTSNVISSSHEGGESESAEPAMKRQRSDPSGIVDEAPKKPTDAPAKDDVPVQEDAPGERADDLDLKAEDAPPEDFKAEEPPNPDEPSNPNSAPHPRAA